jgi:hypothetical protein
VAFVSSSEDHGAGVVVVRVSVARKRLFELEPFDLDPQDGRLYPDQLAL